MFEAVLAAARLQHAVYVEKNGFHRLLCKVTGRRLRNFAW
jgi:hypothetical protein